MPNDEIGGALRFIISAELATPQIISPDPDDTLVSLGVRADALCGDLGAPVETPAATTFGALARALKAGGVVATDRLRRRALRARVKRLVGGMLASTRVAPTGGDSSAWWNELVTQIIWWQCAEKAAGGKALVQSDVPAEASAVLVKCGVVDPAALLAEPERNRATLTDILRRYGLSEGDAREVFDVLVGVAKRVREIDGGSLQRTLRRHANRMAQAMVAELRLGIADNGVLDRALMAWVSTMTRLPIGVWSPSTMDFVHKFGGLGIDEEFLEDVANDAGIDFVNVDQALAQFSEDLCLRCDPAEPKHRFCIRKFRSVGWEVECVDAVNRDAKG